MSQCIVYFLGDCVAGSPVRMPIGLLELEGVGILEERKMKRNHMSIVCSPTGRGSQTSERVIWEKRDGVLTRDRFLLKGYRVVPPTLRQNWPTEITSLSLSVHRPGQRQPG